MRHVTREPFFAEIIESNLNSWVAQAWQWDRFPLFGSIVVTQESQVLLFAVVYHISIGSSEAGRLPFAYQKTQKELMEEQPQIFELLKTSFYCLPIGYIEEKQLFYLLPPQPPKIHSFVRNVSEDELKKFLASTGFLNLLFNSNFLNTEELILAMISRLKKLGLLEEKILADIVEKSALFFARDYHKFKLFIQRVEQIF